jgi:hypothetical protein
MTDEIVWYEELRQRYRPSVVRVLLIGESPPDPRDAERRYFYAPVLSKYDNLYRGVSMAFYGESASFDVRAKVANLERLRDDGVWLVDAVERPVNARTKSERRHAIRENLDGLVARCSAIGPTLGVIVCHGPVYDEAARALRTAGLRVLHDAALPFPLGNTRATFVGGVRVALANAGWAGRVH